MAKRQPRQTNFDPDAHNEPEVDKDTDSSADMTPEQLAAYEASLDPDADGAKVGHADEQDHEEEPAYKSEEDELDVDPEEVVDEDSQSSASEKDVVLKGESREPAKKSQLRRPAQAPIVRRVEDGNLSEKFTLTDDEAGVERWCEMNGLHFVQHRIGVDGQMLSPEDTESQVVRSVWHILDDFGNIIGAGAELVDAASAAGMSKPADDYNHDPEGVENP